MTTPSHTPPHIALLATKAAAEVFAGYEHKEGLRCYGEIAPNNFGWFRRTKSEVTAIIESAITRALLEAAAVDTKRLDWLEKRRVSLSHFWTEEERSRWTVSDAKAHLDPRAAIDSAMTPASLPAAPDAGKGN